MDASGMPESCPCAGGDWRAADFERAALGVDSAGGRFAEVALDRCRRCGRAWLHYFWELEAFSGSGRWYRGPLSDAQARAVTAETAAATLEALPWYLAGGSYFGGHVARRSGPLL
jgi:hypothetical protein